MRRPIHLLWVVALLAAPIAWAVAEEPPPPPRENPPPPPRVNTPAPPRENPPPSQENPPPPIIGSHQIDRYEAINKLQQELKANPKSESDWVILGELSQEVADDLPGEQAAKFYQMSRDAYEKALQLDPDNPGLKAAVAFARDREANASKFTSARNQATQTYLDARRRDLAATRYTPAVRTYAPPVTGTSTVIPTDTNARISSDAAATDLSPAIVTTTVPATTPAPGATVTSPATPETTTSNTLTTPATPSTPTATTMPPPGMAITAPPTGTATTPPTGAVTTATTAPRALERTTGPNVVESAIAPVTATQPVSAPVATETVARSPFGVRQIYSAPIYQPYYTPQGTPYTYSQHTTGAYPPNVYTPGVQPMTVQRYLLQQAPRSTLNAVERQLIQGTTPTVPPPATPGNP
jgi:hypothetical protein